MQIFDMIYEINGLTFCSKSILFGLEMIPQNKKRNPKMRKFNTRAGVAIALWSVFAYIMSYEMVSGVLAILVCLMVATQVIRHEDWNDYDPSSFWLPYGVIGSIIMLACIYAAGFGWMSVSSLSGGLPLVAPVFGVILGRIIRLMKGLPL